MPAHGSAGEPPLDVLSAYGAHEPARPLPGGQGHAWRAGSLVFKPLDLPPEALRWQADVLPQLPPSAAVRLTTPVRGRSGQLVHRDWTAWTFQPGAHRPRAWLAAIAAGQSLHALFGDLARPDWLDRRDNVWARAEAACFGESPVTGHPAGMLVADLLSRVHADQAECQLVHSDLTGNVLLHDALPPAVIDLSLAWRPPAFAAAVVVVDALVWESAPASLIDQAAELVPGLGDQLVRALAFRMLSDRSRRRAPYEAVIQLLAGRTLPP